MAKFSEHLAGYAVNGSRPQYSMSLMDAEALLPTHDGSCAFPELREQTKAAIAAENGATEHQLMSIFGWQTIKEAERYTKAARRKKMAGDAMPLLRRTKD